MFSFFVLDLFCVLSLTNDFIRCQLTHFQTWQLRLYLELVFSWSYFIVLEPLKGSTRWLIMAEKVWQKECCIFIDFLGLWYFRFQGETVTLVFHNHSIDIRSLQFHDILHEMYIVSYARNVPYHTSNSSKTSVNSYMYVYVWQLDKKSINLLGTNRKLVPWLTSFLSHSIILGPTSFTHLLPAALMTQFPIS